MIGNIYRGRNTGQKCNKNISMSCEPVALQKKMLGSLWTEGTSAGSRGAVDKMVIRTMITQVTETNTKLGKPADARFVSNVEI